MSVKAKYEKLIFDIFYTIFYFYNIIIYKNYNNNSNNI